MATTIAILSLATAVGGAVAQADAARKGRHAQQQQASYQQQARVQQQKIAENTNRQNRIGMIRRARQASANTRQQSVNIGAATSTSAAAAASSPFVQAGANMGFQNQQLGFNRASNGFLSQATAAGNAALGFQGQAATAGAISGVGMQVFNAKGGFDTLTSGAGTTLPDTTASGSYNQIPANLGSSFNPSLT